MKNLIRTLSILFLCLSAVSCGESEKAGGGLDKSGIWSLEYKVSDFGDTLGVVGLSSVAIDGTLSGVDGSQTTKRPFEGSGRLFLGVVLNDGKEWPAFVLYGESEQTTFYAKSLTPHCEYQTCSMKLSTEKESVTCEDMMMTTTGGVLPQLDKEAESILAILDKEQDITVQFHLKTRRPFYRPDVEDFRFEVTKEQMAGFGKVHTNFTKKVIRQ